MNEPNEFIAWEACSKCGGYKWTIGNPATTGGMCKCPIELPLPYGWICPKCQKVLAPEVIEHICDKN